MKALMFYVLLLGYARVRRATYMTLLALYCACPSLHAQGPNFGPVAYQATAPSGACSLPNYLTISNANAGGVFQCFGASPTWHNIGSGGSMTWPTGLGGIPNYTGSSSWGATYNGANPIPANFLTQAGLVLTSSSINGVTPTAGGSSTLFLNAAGSYTSPPGGSVGSQYAVQMAGSVAGTFADSGCTAQTGLPFTCPNGFAVPATTYPAASSLSAGTTGANLPSALPGNSAGWLGPITGGTSYLVQLPSTISAGLLKLAAPGTSYGVNVAVATSAAQYETWSVEDGAVGTSALPTSGFPAVPFGVNQTGTTRTIAAIKCFVDGGSGTTFTLVDSLSNNLLGATGACSTGGTSNTLSSTVTLASAVYMKYTLTPDGTAKAVTLVVSGTY